MAVDREYKTGKEGRSRGKKPSSLLEKTDQAIEFVSRERAKEKGGLSLLEKQPVIFFFFQMGSQEAGYDF